LPPYSIKFLTLTFGGTDARAPFVVNNGASAQVQYDVSAMYKVMTKSFHNLIMSLRKIYGSFDYFRVVEAHKDGVPHFHVLLVGANIVPKEIFDDIQRLWCECSGMGFVKLNKVDFNDYKHAVMYTVKYMTKLENEENQDKKIVSFGKGTRIFSASRNALAKITKRSGY
jgi:Bacteriophage replication gene A protein (GPA).